jgi:glucose-1-phosphatase
VALKGISVKRTEGRDGVVKAVIFDFGNVLCRLDRSGGNRILATHCALSPEEVDKRIWGGDLERDAETGRIDSRTQFERIREVIGADPSWSYEEFSRDFMAFLKPHPEGEAALVGVARSGYRTFILSNTSFLHSRGIFQNENLATIPELYALSYKIGFMKPDPRCWLWILDRTGLRPEECMYVDDVQAYCDAAAALGLRSMRYDPETENLLQKLETVL